MRKVAYFIIIFGLILTINGLLHSIYDLWHKQDLVTSAQKKLDREKEKNQKLKAQYSLSQTPGFIEEQAHNKLLLVKPGEQQVLMSTRLTLNQGKSFETNTPNWQRWIALFF